MIITIDDLVANSKSSDILSFLPIDKMKYLTGNNFYVFYYWYDDKTSSITEIIGGEIVSEITLNLNKKRPVRGGLPYDIGFFQNPLDTQNILFYQFLKYYFVTNVFTEKEKHQQILTQFFASCRVHDIENIESKQKNTIYENSFDIYSRDNFVSAVNRFVQGRQQVKDDIIGLADCIDTYSKRTKLKSFYGDTLKKVVMAVKIPNGGLIPEKRGTLRYLYYGENSAMVSGDKMLEEAKKMLRNGFTYSEIFTKTNWFFNDNDKKWRSRLKGDKEVDVPKLPLNSMFVTEGSTFKSKQDEIYDLMNAPDLDSSLPQIEAYIRDGWDVTLGQVLPHNELYKHYPKLYSLPIFYANNTKDFGEDNDYAFFFSPKGYLFIYGNEKNFDFKTVLLHEVQHAIQEEEGFGQGGDLNVAKMIQAFGGEGVKEFFYVTKKLEETYSKEANHDGSYSYERYLKYYNRITLGSGVKSFSIQTEEQYYSSARDMVFEMLNSYLNANDSKKKDLEEFLGKKFCENIAVLIKFYQDGRKVVLKLRGEGLSEQQMHSVFMKNYMLLAGEIESRDVQHISQLEDDILGYALPLTSESIETKKVTAIYKDLLIDEILPNRIYGAVENVEDGGYVVHLYESVSAIPLIHELGHIVGDYIGRNEIDVAIANNFDKSKIESVGGTSEVFCHLFKNYLSKQPLSPRILGELSDNPQFTEKEDIFKDLLDQMFYPKEEEKQEEYQKMIYYLTKLEDDFIETSTEQEIPKAQTEIEGYDVGEIVYLPNTPQNDNYGEIVGIKNGVAELEVLDNGGMKRIHLTLDELVKIENPHAEGYEFFYEGSVVLGKYLTGGVAEKILAENVGGVIYVAQLRRDILKGVKALSFKSDAIFLLASNRNEIVFTYANNPTVVMTLKVDNISDIKIPTKSDSELVLNLTKEEAEAPKQQEEEVPKQETEPKQQEAEEEESEQPKYGRRMVFYALFGVEFMTKNSVSAINKLSDYYTQDFKSEAKRLQEEWEAENPSETYGVEEKELHKSEAEIYAKSKITERASELKMQGI